MSWWTTDRLAPVVAAEQAMKKEELLLVLRNCARDHDHEAGHADADDALLEYINDPEVTKAYEEIAKWYG